ncbi:MAG: SCO family protein [Bdellovibrionales bacterium]|nr:SCO family protein [Bdellovibrionales bacterium]
MTTWLGLLCAAIISGSAWAYDTKVTVTGHELPKELQSVGVTEHLGAQLDMDLQFTDDKGVTAPLRHFFDKNKPAVLAMVYYDCPSLCNYHLNGLTDTMKTLKWTAGQDFDVIAISMDHSEKSDLAAKKKHNYLTAYGRMQTDAGWHFLTGSKENVQKIADQLGFRFSWMPEKKQFAHASVTYVITPEGKISRYLHGIQPDPTTLKLSLLEASSGKIGNMIEQAMMFCFQFDPQKNKYTLYAWNLMRIGAILMVLLLAVLLVPLWRRDLHKRTRT